MLSLTKLKAAWTVLQAGKEVSDKQKWATHQVSANAIAAFLFAIVSLGKACGYDFGIDMQTCADIAIGILAIANVGITVATNKHLGVPAAPVREAQPTVPSDCEAAGTSADAQVANEQDVPSGDQAAVEQSGIDADIRARAEAWVREHSVVQRTNTDNGLRNDA